LLPTSNNNNPLVVVATHHHHSHHYQNTTGGGEYSDESSLTSRRSETNDETDNHHHHGYQQHHQDSSSLATDEEDDNHEDDADVDDDHGNGHRIEEEDEDIEDGDDRWGPQQRLQQRRFTNHQRRRLDGIAKKKTAFHQPQQQQAVAKQKTSSTNLLSDASWIKKKKLGSSVRASLTPPLVQQQQQEQAPEDSEQIAPTTDDNMNTPSNPMFHLPLQQQQQHQRPESSMDQMSDFMGAPTEIMTNRTTDLHFRQTGVRRPRSSLQAHQQEDVEHQLQIMTSGFTCSALPQHYFGQQQTTMPPSRRTIPPTTTVSSPSRTNNNNSNNDHQNQGRFGGRPWPPPTSSTSTSPRSSLFPRSFPQRPIETNSLLSDSSIEGGGSSAAVMGEAANTSAATTTTTTTTTTKTAATMDSAAAVARPDKSSAAAIAPLHASAPPLSTSSRSKSFRLPPQAVQSRKSTNTTATTGPLHQRLNGAHRPAETANPAIAPNRNHMIPAASSFQSQSITSSVGVETGVKNVEQSSSALKSVFTHRTAQATLRTTDTPSLPKAATPAIQEYTMQAPLPQDANKLASQRKSSLKQEHTDIRLPDFLQSHRLKSQHRGTKSDGVLVAKSGRGGEAVQAAPSHASSGWTPMSESGLISEDFSPSRPIQPLFFSNRVFDMSATSPSKAFRQWTSAQGNNDHNNNNSGKALSEPSFPRSRPPYLSQSTSPYDKNGSEQLDKIQLQSGPPEVQRITRVGQDMSEIRSWNRASGKSFNQKSATSKQTNRLGATGESPDPIFCPASPQTTSGPHPLPSTTTTAARETSHEHQQVDHPSENNQPQRPTLTPIRSLLARKRQHRQWPPARASTTRPEESTEEKKVENEDIPVLAAKATTVVPKNSLENVAQFHSEKAEKTSRLETEMATARSALSSGHANIESAQMAQVNILSRSSLRSHALNRHSMRKREVGTEKTSHEQTLDVETAVTATTPNVVNKGVGQQSLRSKLYGPTSLNAKLFARIPQVSKPTEQNVATNDGGKALLEADVVTQEKETDRTRMGRTGKSAPANDSDLVDRGVHPTGFSVKDRIEALTSRMRPRDEVAAEGRLNRVAALRLQPSARDGNQIITADSIQAGKDVPDPSANGMDAQPTGMSRQSLVMGAYLAAMAKSPPRPEDQISKTNHSTDRSVDVQSIRSKFEGSIHSHEEQDDDESVSVKSRRSLFEIELDQGAKESEVGKIRALFESKKPQLSNAKSFKGNSAMKDTWAKFEASSSRPPSDISLKRKVPVALPTTTKQPKGNQTRNPQPKASKIAYDNRTTERSLGNKTSSSPFHSAKTKQPVLYTTKPDIVATMPKPTADSAADRSNIGRQEKSHAILLSDGQGKQEVPAKQPKNSVEMAHEQAGRRTEKVFELNTVSSAAKNDSDSPHDHALSGPSEGRATLIARGEVDGGSGQRSLERNPPAIKETHDGVTKKPAIAAPLNGNSNGTPYSKKLLIHNRFKSFARKNRFATNSKRADTTGVSRGNETQAKMPVTDRTDCIPNPEIATPSNVPATSDNLLLASGNVKQSDRNGTAAKNSQNGGIDRRSPDVRESNVSRSSIPEPHTDRDHNVDKSNTRDSKVVNVIPRDAVSVSKKPLKPEATDRRPEECKSDSDYSDGVTLDVSIADVSCLTNPTALRSKEGNSFQSASHSSSKSSIVADLMETEAKQSEASSSQTSEAAAPLLAAALGLRRSSDDASVFEGFFSARFLSNSISRWENLAKGESSTRDELEYVNKQDVGTDNGWDLQHVHDRLSPASFKKEGFAKFDSSTTDWNAFLAESRLRRSQPTPVDLNGSNNLRTPVVTSPSVALSSYSSRPVTTTRPTTPTRSLTPSRPVTPTTPRTPTTPTFPAMTTRPITPSRGNATPTEGLRYSPREVQMDARSQTNHYSTVTPPTAYSSQSQQSFVFPTTSPRTRSPRSSMVSSTSTSSRSPHATSTHSAPQNMGRPYFAEVNESTMSHASTPLSHFPLSSLNLATSQVNIAPHHQPPASAQSETGHYYEYSNERTHTSPASLSRWRASPKHAALMSRMKSLKESRLLRNASPMGATSVSPGPAAVHSTTVTSVSPHETRYPLHVPTIPMRAAPVQPPINASSFRPSTRAGEHPNNASASFRPSTTLSEPPLSSHSSSSSFRPNSTTTVGWHASSAATTTTRSSPGLPRNPHATAAPPRSYMTTSPKRVDPPSHSSSRIEDELSNSTRSSTRFGGINFETLLEID
jgi:hypothetical protein